MTPPLRIVGLMSGTSADGVDAALVTVSGYGPSTRLELERFVTVDYPPVVREGVLELARGSANPASVATWHFRLGEIFAAAARDVLNGASADLIGSHGQTVAHLSSPELGRATLQIGSPAIIAARTGITVVSDFRSADIAAGGNGAPLVSFVDLMLLEHPNKYRVALNIGGIANVTWIPPAGSGNMPLAFDTGPGNALLDRAAFALTHANAHQDERGALALRGTVDDAMLFRLLQDPYFRRSPPKSTGREEFGDVLADEVLAAMVEGGSSIEDILATLTRFSAKSIAHGITLLPAVDEVFVSGGGVHNDTLMSFLRQEMPDVSIRSTGDVHLPPDAKEAICFAVLANQTIRGQPGNEPACTGAGRSAVLGSISPGANFEELMRRMWS